MKRKLAMLLCSAMILSLGGCGGQTGTDAAPSSSSRKDESGADTGQQDGETVLGICLQDATNLSDIQYVDFAKGIASGSAYDMEFIVNDAKQNAETMLSQIDAMIAQEVDAILVQVKDPYSITPGIEAANNAGIPIICYGALPDSGEFSFVGFEIEDGGRLCGRTMLDYIGGKDPGDLNIFAIAGPPGDEYTEKRVNGFCEGAGIDRGTLVDIQNTQSWSMAEAQAVCENWITAYGLDGIDVIFGGNDQLGLGCVEAIKAAGGDPKDIVVCSVDGNEVGVLSLYHDGLSFCALQSPYEMAKGWITCFENFLNGNGTMTYTFDYSLVTKENAVDVLREVYGYDDAQVAELETQS